MVARVEVTQSFTNPHDRSIEAIYLFPLPADSAVDDMEMVIGDRIVRGRINRRAQARQVYEAARAEGRRAALLEQQRPNLFAQRVANIAPGERIDVRLSYVQALPFEDGAYELVYPMVASNRYDPSDPSAVLGEAGEVREANSVAIALAIDAGMPIGQIDSPTHDIAISRDGSAEARVRLENGTQLANRDFVLRYDVSGDTPRATVMAHRRADSDDGEGHFSLVIQPPAAPASGTVTPREIVFVVDTSSSMAGRPMEHARAVMQRALGTVRAGDTFQVLAFSDRVESLGSRPLAWSEENIARANTFIEGIRATGATEMVPAIEAALTIEDDGDDRLKLVVLVTDGFIGNEADVLRAVAQNLGDARLYSLGVGGSPNRFLLERASEIGRGRTVVATLSEDPEAVAERFAALVDKPVFTDVEIDWGGLAVSDVYPRRVPDLFAGKPLLVHGRFARGGTARVKVRGTVNGRRFERVIGVTLPDASTDDTHAAHATLWARAAVHDRMNRIFLRDDPELIEEVTELGLRYRMVTQYTSFVAVEERRAEPDADGDDAEPEARATVSPARSLPGDPEIRVPAPSDARAVTVILPFGETLSASWESDLGMWTARFLIPADAEEGSYPIEILITHADGRPERMRVWYTVDASAAQLEVEVDGEVRPGGTVILRARQVITERDLIQAGMSPNAEITEARAQFLSDARDVQLRTPSGDVLDMSIAGPGMWVVDYEVPADARGTLSLTLFVVDLAANIDTQTIELEVR
jgi:Ca-activated chloride channel family protein